MKAFIKTRYGGPEILRLREVEKPLLKDGHVLVKIMANSANPADWHILRGKPLLARLTAGLFKPKEPIPGIDFAGIVEQVGNHVSKLNVGDHVFGESLTTGVFSEYACISEKVCARMPDGTGFPELACLPVAGLTALQALVTHGQLKSGELILINGSSGGVGHFAVQIAKVYGATVTAVCSSKNVDFVKSLGADNVIAYDKENIHEHTGKYNLVLDTNGNLNFHDYKRMGERGVMTGFTGIGHMLSILVRKTIAKFPLIIFTAAADRMDLETLARFVKEKKIRVHMDRTFSYEQIPEAISYIESMRTRGKVAMIWENSGEE
jgi:NADPH:quinone reductase-like Zn-dependent oxidoreductase